jgi:hypothetical protein
MHRKRRKRAGVVLVIQPDNSSSLNTDQILDTPGCLIGFHSDIVIVLWKREPTEEAARDLEAAARIRAKEYPEGLRFLHDTTHPFLNGAKGDVEMMAAATSENAKKTMHRFHQRAKDVTAAQAVVMTKRGIAGQLLRITVQLTFMFLGHRRVPTRLSDDVFEAADWLERTLPSPQRPLGSTRDFVKSLRSQLPCSGP